MKLFHTADWHLGKLVQRFYMTEDQRFVLDQFIEAVKEEKPDAVIIAGDLYDRAVPPTEAVDLLDEVLKTIVLDLKTPVLAVAGNHDSPGRLNFGSKVMKANGLHIVGQFSKEVEPVVLEDKHGEVHFYLVPYAEPGVVRYIFEDEAIRSHDDAMKAIVERIKEKADRNARHVFIGHHFITPKGEKQENTSESERPLSIGGAEHVNADYFSTFHYTAFGHLHQAHKVGSDTVRYAGSPLKYSISEQHHKKGFYIVELDKDGNVEVEKRLFTPKREMRAVEGYIEEIEQQEKSEDYVFVKLLDEVPVLYPMEKIRAVYPNAMHVEQKINLSAITDQEGERVERTKLDDVSLFQSFYNEVKGTNVSSDTEKLFQDVLNDILRGEGERV